MPETRHSNGETDIVFNVRHEGLLKDVFGSLCFVADQVVLTVPTIDEQLGRVGLDSNFQQASPIPKIEITVDKPPEWMSYPSSKEIPRLSPEELCIQAICSEPWYSFRMMIDLMRDKNGGEHTPLSCGLQWLWDRRKFPYQWQNEVMGFPWMWWHSIYVGTARQPEEQHAASLPFEAFNKVAAKTSTGQGTYEWRPYQYTTAWAALQAGALAVYSSWNKLKHAKPAEDGEEDE